MKTIRKWALCAGVFSLGFATKVTLVEVATLSSVYYVNKCFDETKPLTVAAESACYADPRKHASYRIVSILNAQPSLWKNTRGRCVGTQGTRPDAYFNCGWWNRFAI
jgi:hypothetical protein